MDYIRLGVLLPGASPVNKGINETYRGMMRTHSGDIAVYAKELPLREIAVELLCAVIGRELDLPIPEPFLVKMHDNQNLGFACADAGYPDLNQFADLRNIHIRQKIAEWPKVIQSACFDEWIANADRHEGNILYDGDSKFLLIDHGLAIREGLAADAAVTNVFMDIATANKDELFRQRIKQKTTVITDSYSKELAEHGGTMLDRRFIQPDITAELTGFLINRLNYLTTMMVDKIKTAQSDLFR